MKSKKWLISLGLAVVLVVAFALPSCGEPAEPVKRLNVGTQTDVPNLNMDEEELEHSNLGCIYKNMVYETLTAYAKVGDKVAGEPDLWYDTNGFIPTLATGFDVTWESRYHPVNEAPQMAQVWTVTLREGVKWHDFATSGEYLDAYDVEFTCKNVLSEWSPDKPVCFEEYWYGDGDIVWWVNATDTHTIEYIYENNITQAHHPSVWAWDCIVPEHIFGPDGNGTYADWNEDPLAWHGEHIGTGPYKFAEYKPGQYHKWVRNDDWWGESLYGPIEIEEIYIKIFPTLDSLTAAFEAGEIDTYMSSFSYSSITKFDTIPDIKVEVVPGVAVYYLGFNFWAESGNYSYYYFDHDEWIYDYQGLNYTVNPLHDKALRKAIAYAIDTQKIVDVVLGGATYAQLTDSWIYPGTPGHKAGLEMYAQNVTKAAQLLTGEGYYQDGTPAVGYLDGGYWVSPYTDEKLLFKLRTSTDLTEFDTGQSIMADLVDFGIDIDFLSMDSTTFLEKLYEPWSNGWDMMVGEEEPSADPVADWIWMLVADPWMWGWDWCPTYWYDEDFNTEYMGLYTAVDPQVARDAMQVIANEEMPMYMLYQQHVVSAYWTDRWTNWYNELGGPLYWYNQWNMYGLHWVGGD